MPTRRNILFKTGLMLPGVSLTGACRSWQKSTLQDKPARSALSNSIWLPNWRMQKSLDSTLNALQQRCVHTVSPFWYDVNDDGVLTAKPGSDGVGLDLECIALTTDIPTAKKVRAIYTDLCRCISTALATVNKTLAITVMARWSDDYAVWRGKGEKRSPQ